MSWILLRGLTREARHWGGFTSMLAQRSGEVVVTLDLPGSGEFAALPSPASVSGIVEFLREQMKAKNLQAPHKLLALSLGGMVATDWAQRYPAEIERLVLINTSMRPFSSITQRLRPTNWPQLAMLSVRWADADYAEAVVHDLTCNANAEREANIAAWLQVRKSAPVMPANAARQLLAAARFECAEATPRCPTLVLSSAGDRLVNPVCSTKLAAAWQAKHVQHPWAGHDLPHDDGEWVCSQLGEWLASSSAA